MSKAKVFTLVAFFILTHGAGILYSQSLGLNNATPDASSILDATATNRGILIPRVALTATNAVGPIAAPADALLVYNTATAGGAGVNVTPGFYYYSTAASAWIRLLSGGGSPGPRWDQLVNPTGALTLSHGTNATIFNFANVGTAGFAMNATAMTTGSLLDLASTNAAATGNIFSVTSNSTGVPVNGLVRFNFNGIRTAAGNAFQIDDISTTAATTMQLNANALTTGRGLSVTTNGITTGNGILVSSSSAGITTGALLQLSSTGVIGNASGSVLNVNSTGVNTNGYLATVIGNSIAAGGLFNASTSSAASTGTLFRVASTGASTGAVGMFSNAGTGLSLRINDDGTDADATPIVADAAGNLIVGAATTAPTTTSKLHVRRTTSGTILDLDALDLDLDFRIGDSDLDNWGYYWRYAGTGIGDANYLHLYSENSAGADFEIFRFGQNAGATGWNIYGGYASTGITVEQSGDLYSSAKIGVGTNTPDASASLDIVSASRGVLIPRVALTATNAVGPIAAPADALLVYNTATAGGAGVNVTPGFYFYSTAATAWIRLLSSGGSPGPRWDQLVNPTGALTLSHGTNATIFNFANVGTAGFAMNATAMTTGSLLDLASTNAAATGNIFSVTSNSTGVPVNGLVRFNFNGNRTAAGNAFQIDDISTTAATTMQLNANALTTGRGLSVTTNGITTGNGILVSSSSAGITTGALLQLSSTGAIGNASGSVLNVSSTGVNTNGYLATVVGNSIAAGGLFNASTSSAASTGTLFRVASTGASTGAVGMFSNAGSGLTLRINDDGTDADATPVVVDATGRIGIGTAAPVANLDIHGGANPAYLVQHNNASGSTSTDGFELSLGNASETWLWNYENAFMSFGTNNAERMTILGSGLVGIGINNPVSLLHVAGTAQLGTASTTTGSLKLFQSGSANATILQTSGGAGVTYILPGADGTNGQQLVTNGAGVLTWVNPTGVPAGTTSWDQVLPAAANRTSAHGAFITDFSYDGVTTGTAFTMRSSGLTTGRLLDVSTNSAAHSGILFRAAQTAAGSGTVGMISNAGTGLSLMVNDDGTDADASPFAIDAAGNVGIGNAAPAVKLDVEGTAQIGVSGTTITNIIKATITQDIGNCAAAGNLVETFAVPNAAVSSSVIVSPQTALTNGLLIAYARVSAAGTVEVKFRNVTLGAINMASMDWYITVIE